MYVYHNTNEGETEQMNVRQQMNGHHQMKFRYTTEREILIIGDKEKRENKGGHQQCIKCIEQMSSSTNKITRTLN
jgi:hypothetical protein